MTALIQWILTFLERGMQLKFQKGSKMALNKNVWFFSCLSGSLNFLKKDSTCSIHQESTVAVGEVSNKRLESKL